MMKTLYRHKETGDIYRVLHNNGMFKHDGHWHSAILYIRADYSSSTKYMRETDDFFSNFEEVLDNGV